MRIIAGRLRGRRLEAPRGDEITRPTADRVREALFSILTSRVDGARVLDLFAGSGALSLEAVSRGAASAVLCDSDRRAQAAIEQNVRELAVTDQVLLLKCDAKAALQRLRGRSFDLVFLDPPYAAGLLRQTLEGIAQCDLLAEGGLIVAETSSREQPEIGEGFRITDQRRYGAALLTFLEGGKEP